MIRAVSSGHYSCGNACRSMIPTWQETASIQVLIACAISLSLSVRDVTKRKWRLWSRRCFVCCSLRSMNQLFLFSGPSSDNFRVISHLPIGLGIGISSFRQQGVFVKRNVQDVHMCQKKVWNEWDSLIFAVRRNLWAMQVMNWRCRLWLCGGCCERDWKWSPMIFTWCNFFNMFSKLQKPHVTPWDQRKYFLIVTNQKKKNL
jgi:hypothetical protein